MPNPRPHHHTPRHFNANELPISHVLLTHSPTNLGHYFINRILISQCCAELKSIYQLKKGHTKRRIFHCIWHYDRCATCQDLIDKWKTDLERSKTQKQHLLEKTQREFKARTKSQAMRKAWATRKGIPYEEKPIQPFKKTLNPQRKRNDDSRTTEESGRHSPETSKIDINSAENDHQNS